MTAMQERISKLEGAFEQLPLTLQSFQNQIAGLQDQIMGLQSQIDGLQQRLNALENRMTMLFIGMIAMMGMMMAGFVTLFVAIMLRS